VFADALLGLMIVFLIAAPGTPNDVLAKLAVTPTAVLPSPTPTPTCQTTVLLKKNELHVDSGGGAGDPSAEQLRGAFSPFLGQRAGLVLTFGHAARPTDGEDLAKRVNATLVRLFPQIFNPQSIMESFHYIDAPTTGEVDFEVYFISESCQ